MTHAYAETLTYALAVGMNHGGQTATLQRIGDANAFEFEFDPSLLDRLAWMYENLVAPKLDLQALRANEKHDKLQGHNLRFHTEPYGSLAWVSADDLATHREFQNVFDRLGLAEAVMPLVDWSERIVMYQGFYVISNGVAEANWHVDYHEGGHAYTLLTPLYDLDPEHGHLLFRSGELTMRYEYRRGAGAIVGERFLHATEPHPPGRPRILVSMTFGTDRMEHWPVLEKTVGGQSPFVVMPCGHQRGTCICLWT